MVSFRGLVPSVFVTSVPEQPGKIRVGEIAAHMSRKILSGMPLGPLDHLQQLIVGFLLHFFFCHPGCVSGFYILCNRLCSTICCSDVQVLCIHWISFRKTTSPSRCHSFFSKNRKGNCYYPLSAGGYIWYSNAINKTR